VRFISKTAICKDRISVQNDPYQRQHKTAIAISENVRFHSIYC
jgi:hypothetical protein